MFEEYFYDEPRGKVVCKLSCTCFDAYEAAQEMLEANGLSARFTKSRLTERDGLIPDKFIGVATCHPDDKFDVKTGERIAFQKAYKNYLRAKVKAARRYIARCMKKLEDADAFFDAIPVEERVIQKD